MKLVLGLLGLLVLMFCSALAFADSLDPGDTRLPDGGIQDWDGGTECACASGALSCTIINPNEDIGGAHTIPAPTGTTLRPGWSGAGCIRKACSEPAGAQGSSWPPNCPP